MKKEYLEFHEKIKPLYKDDKYLQKIGEFFDLYFKDRFKNTKDLGNETRYDYYQGFYGLLLLELQGIQRNFELDFLEQSIEIIKSNNEPGTMRDKLDKLFEYSLTYQNILFANFVFRFSNIEEVMRKVEYDNIKEVMENYRKQKIIPYLSFPAHKSEKEKLIDDIKRVKGRLTRSGQKLTLKIIAENLFRKYTTLHSQLNKHKIKWKEI